MSDPSAYWLNVMNIVLGVVVLLGCGAVALGVLQEFAVRRRKRATVSGLDREVADLFGSHAFQLPNLGVTMADGGDPLDKKEDR